MCILNVHSNKMFVPKEMGQNLSRRFMKKNFVILCLLFSAQAFAQKSMVTLTGFDTGNQADRSINFTNSHGGSDNSKERNLNLNYAYAITNAFQIGFDYTNYKKTSGGDIVSHGDSYTGYGIKAIYNFSHRLYDTTYVSVGYGILNFDDSDETFDFGNGNGEVDFKRDADTDYWTFELGHRFSLGTIWGMNFNYSPAVSLSFSHTDIKVKATDVNIKDEESFTNVSLNLVKFDVLF